MNVNKIDAEAVNEVNFHEISSEIGEKNHQNLGQCHLHYTMLIESQHRSQTSRG